MLVGHLGLRSLGHTGFQCQSHTWFEGRLDAKRFVEALERLNQRFPVVSGRIRPRDGGLPAWQFHTFGRFEFNEHTLKGDELDHVLKWAFDLYAQPLDLDRSTPISFNLLHLPTRDDVLICRFAHPLMDGKSPELLIKELNRLYNDPNSDVTPQEVDDGVSSHLCKYPVAKRSKAAFHAIRQRIFWPRKSIRLSRSDAPKWVLGPYRAIVREMSIEQTTALQARVRKLSGFPNLCAAVLASVFRALVANAPGPIKPNDVVQTDVPINVRPPDADQPIFHNCMSFVTIRMRANQLDNRDTAIREITAQMRDQIRKEIDLGTLQLIQVMSRFDSVFRMFIKMGLQHAPFSLAFGFQGQALVGLDTVCALPVSRYYCLIAALHPPGATVQINQFRGKMNIVLTYPGDAIADDVARRYVECIVDDLTA